MIKLPVPINKNDRNIGIVELPRNYKSNQFVGYDGIVVSICRHGVTSYYLLWCSDRGINRMVWTPSKRIFFLKKPRKLKKNLKMGGGGLTTKTPP